MPTKDRKEIRTVSISSLREKIDYLASKITEFKSRYITNAKHSIEKAYCVEAMTLGKKKGERNSGNI